jgi:hypothetical protein
MKRYVNFMSNPDERTAIDQYGKGDKSFGVAVMMSTLPGLPMFGHGQIEGYTEKYGMEYYRPRYDESPDWWLIERHDRELAPLLKRRWLFAESYNFLLYDFFHDSGSVDENVFAYSNRVNDQRALIVYNNVYGSTQGTIRISAAYADKGSGQLHQRSLWEGLGLGDRGSILSFRDSLTGLEYLRRAHEIADRGLRLELHAYQSHVLLDWRELHATAGKPWDRLCDHLGGRGVPSLEDALINLELRPVHDALRAALDPHLVHMLAELAEPAQVAGALPKKTNGKGQMAFIERAWSACAELLTTALAAYARRTGSNLAIDVTDLDSIAPVFRKLVRDAVMLPAMEAMFPAKWPANARRMLPNANPQLPSTALWGPVLAWILLETVAEAVDASHKERAAAEVFDRLRFREPLAQVFHALGLEGEEGWRAAARINALFRVECDLAESAPKQSVEKTSEIVGKAGSIVAPSKPPSGAKTAVPVLSVEDLGIPVKLWSDPDICWLTGAHVSENKTYLVREPYEKLLWWLQLPLLMRMASAPEFNRADALRMSQKIDRAHATIEAAGYRLDKLLETTEPEKPGQKKTPLPERESSPDIEADEGASKNGKIDPPEQEGLGAHESQDAETVGPMKPDGSSKL